MAKASRTPKHNGDSDGAGTAAAAQQQDLAGLPHADKLMAFVDEPASDPAGTGIIAERPVLERRTKGRERRKKGVAVPTTAKHFSAADAACEAGNQIAALVGMKVDSVSAVTRTETGWEVIVNVIELARIPHSTDVLAAYHVGLDAEGNLQSYSRSLRYMRDQTGECQ